MRRTIVLAALTALLGLAIAATASAGSKTGGTNNGGNTPSCGAACDQSHNPTDFTKPCTPVPGNGCHQLPDTPCERGHGGTEIGNKHCGPDLAILKEQSPAPEGPDAVWTHNTVNSLLDFGDWYYRITVTNFSNKAYTLTGSDQLCDEGQFAFEPGGPGEFSTPNSLAPLGTDVYYCEIDPTAGAGFPGDSIPDDAIPGLGPYPLTNSVTMTAAPVGGGTSVTLTDSVTANFN